MKVNFAISGAGWIADFYYNAYSQLKNNFDLKGCAGNPSEEGHRRLSGKCNQWGTKTFDSFEDLLADSEIQGVGIFSPTHLHFKQAMAAMEKGKHVLVEKPVALDVFELNQLKETALKNNVILFPGHNFIYRPVVKKAKAIVDSGVLGKISYGSFRAVHFIPDEHAAGWRKKFNYSGGGAMMDSGTHLVYQLLYLLGKPEFFSCFSGTHHYFGMDGEDTCQISMQFRDGIIGQVFQSWSASDSSAGEIRIEGDKGVLLITDSLYLNGEEIEDDSSYESSFYHTLKAFGGCITDGAAPLSGIDEAVLTLKLIQDSYESAKSRKVMNWKE